MHQKVPLRRYQSFGLPHRYRKGNRLVTGLYLSYINGLPRGVATCAHCLSWRLYQWITRHRPLEKGRQKCCGRGLKEKGDEKTISVLGTEMSGRKLWRASHSVTLGSAEAHGDADEWCDVNFVVCLRVLDRPRRILVPFNHALTSYGYIGAFFVSVELYLCIVWCVFPCRVFHWAC